LNGELGYEGYSLGIKIQSQLGIISQYYALQYPSKVLKFGVALPELRLDNAYKGLRD